MCRITPPRVREVSTYPMTLSVVIRITPACAGSITLSPFRFSQGWDHPRVCGKYAFHCVNAFVILGSPPRVREVYTIIKRSGIDKGITPACAGSIKYFSINSCVAWDHPRVCGKYSSLTGTILKLSGSPPRVREVSFKFFFTL